MSRWNPWNCYGKYPGSTEENVLAAAHTMKDRLASVGYEYIALDCGYSTKQRDAEGNLQVNKTRFPRGIRWLADQIHEMGLKFG